MVGHAFIAHPTVKIAIDVLVSRACPEVSAVVRCTSRSGGRPGTWGASPHSPYFLRIQTVLHAYFFCMYGCMSGIFGGVAVCAPLLPLGGRVGVGGVSSDERLPRPAPLYRFVRLIGCLFRRFAHPGGGQDPGGLSADIEAPACAGVRWQNRPMARIEFKTL